MPRSALPFAVVLVVAACAAPSARAASQAQTCQTVSGWTLCLRSTAASTALALSCRTEGRNTICLGSGGLRCEVAAGAHPLCRGGAGYELDIRPAVPRLNLSWPTRGAKGIEKELRPEEPEEPRPRNVRLRITG
jgi:hypothetical protein